MIYLIIFIIILSFSILIDFIGLKNSLDIPWYFLFFVLFLLMAFSYKLGGDTFNYLRDFEEFPTISELSFADIFEFKYSPFWVILVSTIKSIFNDFIALQILRSFFINAVVFWFANRFCKYRFTFVLFYYFYFYLYFNTEIQRESISICFFLLSIPYFLSSNWKKYYAIAAIALMFHYSSVIIFIFPFLKNLTFNIRNLLIVSISLFMIPKVVLLFFPPIFQELYDIYTSYQSNVYGYIYTFLCFIAFPSILLIIQRYFISDEYQFKDFTIIFYLFSIYAFFSPSISLRFFNYIIPVSIIFFINLLFELYQSKKASIIFLFFIIPSVLGYKLSEYIADTSSTQQGTRYYTIWYPYTHIFGINSKSQMQVIQKREDWIESHFTNMSDELKDLLF
jgi:hypothetical protein